MVEFTFTVEDIVHAPPQGLFDIFPRTYNTRANERSSFLFPLITLSL